jgi:hypothetical protein
MTILRTTTMMRINPRKTKPTSTKTQMGTIPQTFFRAMTFHLFSGGFSETAVNAATLI